MKESQSVSDPIVSTMNEVATRALQGDRDAFGELYDVLIDPLSRYLYPMTGSKDMTMDIIHDVFVRLWENRHKIIIKGSAQALIYTMARNHAINVLKRSNRSISTDFESWQPSFEHHSLQPDAAGTEFARVLNTWIQELPPRRSEAFMLSRFHDLSHAQIGLVMNLSERTVDTHIQHALRDLRERVTRLEAES